MFNFLKKLFSHEDRRIFDWKKATKILMVDFDNIEEAYAGLKEDWFHTSDCIFKNGVIQKGD